MAHRPDNRLRYVRETVALLESLAPTLQAALRATYSRDLRWLLLDGTCTEIDRAGTLRHPEQGEHVDRY